MSFLQKFLGKSNLVEDYMNLMPDADMIYKEDRSSNGINRVFVAIVNPDQSSKIPLITFQKVGFSKKNAMGTSHFNFYSYDNNNLSEGDFSAGPQIIESFQVHTDGAGLYIKQEKFVDFVKNKGIDFEKLYSKTVLFETSSDDVSKFEKLKENIKDKKLFSQNPANDELIRFVMDSIYYADGKQKFPELKLGVGPERLINKNAGNELNL